MLHYIKGTLAMKMASEIVVEAGGLGYEITVPANSSVYLAHEGDQVTVYTAMMVREDDVSLYGFGDKNELDTFRKLITVSGVGAKAAIAILSAMPLHEVHQAIILEDAKSLTRANGIGKKTAERIVLELKDKIGALDSSEDIEIKVKGIRTRLHVKNVKDKYVFKHLSDDIFRKILKHKPELFESNFDELTAFLNQIKTTNKSS